MLNNRTVAVMVALSVLSVGGLGSFTSPASQAAREASPVFTFWFLTVGTSTCLLTTGVCSMTMANGGTNSSYDLALVDDRCAMTLIYAIDNTDTYYTVVNGTVGGQILNGIPSGANVTATCTMPISKLALEPNGQAADGSFTMKLVNNLDSIPAGTSARVYFNGAWFAPIVITTTVTETVTATSIVTSQSSSPQEVGGIPEFPYQALTVAAFTIIVAVSFIVARRRVRKLDPVT